MEGERITRKDTAAKVSIRPKRTSCGIVGALREHTNRSFPLVASTLHEYSFPSDSGVKSVTVPSVVETKTTVLREPQVELNSKHISLPR
jgi:hypothetical protein